MKLKRHSNKTMEMRMFSLPMALSFVCSVHSFFPFFLCFSILCRTEEWQKFCNVENFVAIVLWCCHSSLSLAASLADCSSAFIDGTFSTLFERMCRSLNGSIISILLLITNEIRHALKTTHKKLACITVGVVTMTQNVCADFSIR